MKVAPTPCISAGASADNADQSREELKKFVLCLELQATKTHGVGLVASAFVKQADGLTRQYCFTKALATSPTPCVFVA
jgi:hypothetical protein